MIKQSCFLLLLCFLVTLPRGLKAAECDFQDGGYCVDAISKETFQAIEKSSGEAAGRIRAAGEKTGFGKLNEMVLTPSSLYVQYETLWDGLTQAGMASESEKKTAFEEAGEAGGTKIGGVNLVVLAARTLQKLADLKLLTMEEAQGILDRSRRR